MIDGAGLEPPPAGAGAAPAPLLAGRGAVGAGRGVGALVGAGRVVGAASRTGAASRAGADSRAGAAGFGTARLLVLAGGAGRAAAGIGVGDPRTSSGG